MYVCVRISMQLMKLIGTDEHPKILQNVLCSKIKLANAALYERVINRNPQPKTFESPSNTT